jgi:hypothetical protein
VSPRHLTGPPDWLGLVGALDALIGLLLAAYILLIVVRSH